MSETNGIDIAPFAQEIFEDVFDELRVRMPDTFAELPESDRIAITTAIGKAAWRGMIRGIAVLTHAINEAEHDIAIAPWFQGPAGNIGEPEPWARDYGDSA